MKLHCVLCKKEIDSKKEDVYKTTNWVLEEILALNNLKLDGQNRRVPDICSDCWSNKLKKKPSKENYYWIYNKKV